MKYALGVRRGCRFGLLFVLVTLLAGCGLDLSALPLPAPTGRGSSYRLTVVFSNALNLPAKAKVRLLGADVGEVESIDAQDFTARVRARIHADVPCMSAPPPNCARPPRSATCSCRSGPARTRGQPPPGYATATPSD